MATSDPPTPAPTPIPENRAGIKPVLSATPENLAKVLEDRPILWVGAGASVAAGYPGTGRLIQALIEAADDPIDPKLPFFEVTDKFVESVGEGTLANLLQREIGPPRDPAPLHEAIARLAGAGRFSALVTTNYDDLLERALSDAGVPYVLQPLESNAPVDVDGHLRLLKLHGSREDWEKIVLSADSYRKFGRRYPFLNAQLDILLRQRPVLFVGCSLQDPRILDWLADLPPGADRGLKRWRVLMTDSAWKAAAEYTWERGHASGVLSRGNIRPLILKNHSYLGRLLTEVGQRWTLVDATHRLNLTFEIQPDGPWKARIDDIEWQPENPLNDQEWQQALEDLQKATVQPIRTNDRGDPPAEASADIATVRTQARRVGERLTALLSSEARSRLVEATHAGRQGATFLLVVRVQPAIPGMDAERLADRVLAFPWELLRIEDRFPIEDGTLDLAREAVIDKRPIHELGRDLFVVAAVASPIDANEFDYEEETYRLWKVLDEQGAEKRLFVTDLGTLQELVEAVELYKPPVVHFSGHIGSGILYFEDEAARTNKVSAEELVRRLRITGPLPQLIYLSASQATAEAGARNIRQPSENRRDVVATSDVAPITAAFLHRAGFSQVVAYFGPIGGPQATRAAATFYEALAVGKPSREAVRRARQVLTEPVYDGGRPTHRYPLGWTQLSLYQRGSELLTTLPPPQSDGTAPLGQNERLRQIESLSTLGHVPHLSFGFVGRREPRARAIRLWKRGKRCSVVFGFGGLGKTTLCTELAPRLAKLLNRNARILAFDCRHASSQGYPISALYQEVQAASTDPRWRLSRLPELERNGVTVEVLTAAIMALTKSNGSLLIYLDNADCLQVPVGDGEFGAWKSLELRQFWDFLIRLAAPGGPVGILASSRYLPENTPAEARFPLPPMSRYETIKLFTWWPTLQRVPPGARSLLAEQVYGHPKAVEYLESEIRGWEEQIVAPGGTVNWRHTILKPLAERALKRVEDDLQIAKIWETLGSEGKEHLGRCSVLEDPVPWEAIMAVTENAGTATQLVQTGMLSPYHPDSGSELWWALHPLIRADIRRRWQGNPKDAHRRFGEWFQNRIDEDSYET